MDDVGSWRLATRLGSASGERYVLGLAPASSFLLPIEHSSPVSVTGCDFASGGAQRASSVNARNPTRQSPRADMLPANLSCPGVQLSAKNGWPILPVGFNLRCGSGCLPVAPDRLGIRASCHHGDGSALLHALDAACRLLRQSPRAARTSRLYGWSRHRAWFLERHVSRHGFARFRMHSNLFPASCVVSATEVVRTEMLS